MIIGKQDKSHCYSVGEKQRRLKQIGFTPLSLGVYRVVGVLQTNEMCQQVQEVTSHRNIFSMQLLVRDKQH